MRRVFGGRVAYSLTTVWRVLCACDRGINIGKRFFYGRLFETKAMWLGETSERRVVYARG